jgi:N-carbamoylputrescine amidase
MTEVMLAATQFSCSWDRKANLDKAEEMVRAAAAKGAQIILLPELFEAPYFCKDQLQKHFALAAPFRDNPVIGRFQSVARELGVVLPVSFFEAAGKAFFNSLAIVDADGSVRALYRKSHIPDGPGYTEKYYFSPGDTGFMAVETAHATIGCAICWDQWFPECARAMALKGAEILFYPTAIGSEPQDASLNSQEHWTRVMQGHAGANLMPLVASNRYGVEEGQSCTLTFYGSSFIAGPQGELRQQAGKSGDAILTQSFDLQAIAAARASWGLFRDRRPELYGALLTLDGETRHKAAG